jgi:hypothetical protein
MPVGESATALPRLERVVIPTPRPPGRFRVGRWWLVAEGVLVVQLAGVAIAELSLHPGHASGGASLRGLMLTPVRVALLLAFGVTALLAARHRRATTVVTAIATVVFLALTAAGDAAVTACLPVKWGVDPHNSALYAVLLVYNFTLLIWLVPDIGDELPDVLRS